MEERSNWNAAHFRDELNVTFLSMLLNKYRRNVKERLEIFHFEFNMSKDMHISPIITFIINFIHAAFISIDAHFYGEIWFLKIFIQQLYWNDENSSRIMNLLTM